MMIGAIALEEKLHAKKSLIVGLFGIVSLILGTYFNIIPFGNVILPGGETLKIPVYITAIDWSVIAIILGSSLFVDIVSRSGLFSWIAIKLTKTSYGDPLKLLWYYSIMTVLFSAVLNNVTAMIIVGSLTAVSLTKLDRRELLLGFLLIEGLLTNVGGLMTLISSVPNIIVGNTAGISFIEFFVRAGPFVALATVTTVLLGARLFSIKGLKVEEERQQAQTLISSFDEKDGIGSSRFFWFAAFMLLLFIGVIADASVLPIAKELGIGFIAVGFAAIMLIKYKSDVDQFYKAIDWDLVAFFMALFVVINVMEHAQVLEWIGYGISFIIGDGKSLQGTGSLLLASATASSVTDNIPLSAMLAKILAAGGTAPDSALWWSVVFGANLGGNLTPIGSASTLVAVTIMHKQDLGVSFLGFVKKAAPFAALQLLLAVGYVLLVLY
jgi:Na+/H+ antiporter NhaD/arsenite permease-like protein